MSTILYQVEYEHGNLDAEYPDDRKLDKHKFFLDMCMETVEDYALRHGYDYKLITKPAQIWYDIWGDFKTDQSFFYGHGRKHFYIWIYALKELAEKYDHIIIVDTDVYVLKPEIPFPIDNTGFVCYSPSLEYNFNCGVLKLDKETANLFYDWSLTNLLDDEGQPGASNDQNLVERFLKEHPERFNPILPGEFNTSTLKVPQPIDPPVFYHLSSTDDVANKDKYDVLCTILEKYT